jgi:hypothetical protein
MWPRASAVAERLWSEATVTDIQDAKQRIQVRKSLKKCISRSFFDLNDASECRHCFCAGDGVSNVATRLSCGAN